MKQPKTNLRFAYTAGAIALCTAMLPCCTSGSHGSAQSSAPIAERESAQLAPIVNRYKKQQAVTGYDVKGTTLVISADAEKFSELDEDTELALKGSLLASWVKTWSAYHPHQHAKLRLLIQNYYGQEITSVSKAL